MLVILLGINHKTAPIEVRERFAFASAELPAALRALKEEYGNAAILSTCNRTELYVVGGRGRPGRSELLRFLGRLKGEDAEQRRSHFYFSTHERAVDHIFRVAAGLESMILGESEILGQVRNAYAASAGAGTSGPILDRLFHAAIHVGRQARSETAIGRYAVSVSSTAVGLARKVLGDLQGSTVLVVSAGEAGKLTARNLKETGVARLLVTSRTQERAAELASELGGQALPFDELGRALAESDIVISSTGAPTFLIDETVMETTMRSRNGRPLVLIDIAVPRDVDPSVRRFENVHLYDIDDLKAVVDGNMREREKEVGKVEALVEEEVSRFVEWYRALDVIPTIAALRDHAERVRRLELDKTLARLPDLSADEKARVEAMTRAIVKKMLHQPIARLKSEGGDGELYVAALRDLFDLGQHSSES
jgi:glutamyl-tRNA reductase